MQINAALLFRFVSTPLFGLSAKSFFNLDSYSSALDMFNYIIRRKCHIKIPTLLSS